MPSMISQRILDGRVELTPYRLARLEHVWRLRQEGMSLGNVGKRLGLSKERVRQLQHEHECVELWRQARA